MFSVPFLTGQCPSLDMAAILVHSIQVLVLPKMIQFQLYNLTVFVYTCFLIIPNVLLADFAAAIHLEIAIPSHFESSGISGLLCQISGNSGIFPEFLCTQLICFKTAFTALYSDETCYLVYYSKSPKMTLLLNKQ